MKLGRLLPLLVGVLTLGACATPWQVAEVQDIETMTASGGTAFTRALLDEYRTQAHYEAAVENEWRHAVIFARKGARAAGGEIVPPEDPAAWEIPAAAVKPLAAAHAELVADLDAGARDRQPELAAKTQAAFDCWVEEEWENDADESCKTTVLANLPKLAPPAPVVAVPPLKVVKTFVVYFDYDKDGLNEAARKVLAEVVAAQAEIKPARISVSGYTDTMGGTRYNQKLSERRAATVAAALSGMGVAARLDPAGFGKTHLAVKTRNHVREAKNRRVEIYFESPDTATAPGKSGLLLPAPAHGLSPALLATAPMAVTSAVEPAAIVSAGADPAAAQKNPSFPRKQESTETGSLSALHPPYGPPPARG